MADLSLANRRFHRLLYSRCPNGLLCSFLDTLQDQAALISVTGWEQEPTFASEAAEHQAILDAIAAGDFDKAAFLTREHINGFSQRLLSRLAGGAGP